MSTTREFLLEVAESGVRLGFWTITQVPDEDDSYGRLSVSDAAGLSFTLYYTKTWNTPPKIVATISYLVEGAERVGTRDALRYGEATIEASCTASRDPEAIAKDLNRRVVAHPDGKRQAQAVRDLLNRRLAQREALDGHLAALGRLGFEVPQHASRSYYKADVWRAGMPRMEVSADGCVSVDRLDIPVEKVPALLALLGVTPEASAA